MRTFLSIDPSLRNTAVVWGSISPDGNKLIFDNWRVIHTDPNSTKGKFFQSSVLDVANVIEELEQLVKEKNPDVLFIELPSGAQSFKSAVSLGCTFGIMGAALNQLKEGSVFEFVKVGDVKEYSTGNRKAEKQDIMDWAETSFPDFPFERRSDGALLKARMEHVCDSIAIAVAGKKQLINK